MADKTNCLESSGNQVWPNQASAVLRSPWVWLFAAGAGHLITREITSLSYLTEKSTTIIWTFSFLIPENGREDFCQFQMKDQIAPVESNTETCHLSSPNFTSL